MVTVTFSELFLFRYEEKLADVGVENIATLDLDVGSIIKSKQNETLTEKFKKVEHIGTKYKAFKSYHFRISLILLPCYKLFHRRTSL